MPGEINQGGKGSHARKAAEREQAAGRALICLPALETMKMSHLQNHSGGDQKGPSVLSPD